MDSAWDLRNYQKAKTKRFFYLQKYCEITTLCTRKKKKTLTDLTEIHILFLVYFSDHQKQNCNIPRQVIEQEQVSTSQLHNQVVVTLPFSTISICCASPSVRGDNRGLKMTAPSSHYCIKIVSIVNLLLKASAAIKPDKNLWLKWKNSNKENNCPKHSLPSKLQKVKKEANSLV